MGYTIIVNRIYSNSVCRAICHTTQGCAAVAVFCAFSACAQAAEQLQTAVPSRPPYPQMTYDEDNRFLANPALRTEPLDRLKFIPLSSSNADYYLSFGAFIRERVEYLSEPNWGSGPPGSAYFTQRYQVHADLHLGERIRLFGELGSSLEDGRTGGPRPGLDEDRLDLHQAFLDLRLWQWDNSSLTLRAGRQEMLFGAGNLISTRDGRNIRATFDGFRLTLLAGEWSIDAFATRQTENNPGIFDDRPNSDLGLWGIYAVRPLSMLPGGHIDAYYLGNENKQAKYDAEGTGYELRHTIGTRLWGSTEHWDYSEEADFQFGRFRSEEIRAWAVSAEAGYRLDSILLAPRFGLRAAAYSGNQNPGGGTLGTFNSLNERGPYFSYAEWFGRRNLIAVQPSLQLNLTRKLSLTPNTAFFWRESTRDGLYSPGGAIEVTGQKSNASYIGNQTGAQLQWKLDRHVTFMLDYEHFLPAAFLKDSTAGKSVDYFTAWLDLRF